MRRLTGIAFLFFALFAMTGTASASAPENTIYLDLKDGRVVIELLPNVAPEHVKRIKELTRTGFYDGLTIHRVIDGSLSQAGVPHGPGARASSLRGRKGVVEGQGRAVN